jgi:UDP-N-acetylmuramate dehydrogenase
MTESIDREVKNQLKERFNQSIRFNEPMTRHTYFRVGGPADAFATPETLDEFGALIRLCRQQGLPHLVIGGGSNLLVKDDGIAGVVIVLHRCLNRIKPVFETEKNATVSAQAGVKLQALCRFAVDKGMTGLNFALGIPGTVGGAVTMNAGTALGCMADVIESVKIMLPVSGEFTRIDRDRLDFRYRSLSWTKAVSDPVEPPPIIIDVHCRLEKSDPLELAKEAKTISDRRKSSQPTSAPSAGCFFKNPSGNRTAGELIDKAGLKGISVGGAAVSAKHANFIINTGNASADDILALMRIVQARVSEKFRIELEPEVRIIGR